MTRHYYAIDNPALGIPIYVYSFKTCADREHFLDESGYKNGLDYIIKTDAKTAYKWMSKDKYNLLKL